MNSSFAPLGPRSRNSLMMRLPAAYTGTTYQAITPRMADTARSDVPMDLRISISLQRTVRTALPSRPSQVPLGSWARDGTRNPAVSSTAGLRKRFDVDEELEVSRLLNAQQESHVDGRAIGERRGERDAQAAVEPAAIGLRRRLLQRRAIHRDVRRAAAAGRTVHRHHDRRRRLRTEVGDAGRRRERRDVDDPEAEPGDVAAGVVDDRAADVERAERRAGPRIAREIAHTVRRIHGGDA